MDNVKIIAYYSYSGNTREVATAIYNELGEDIFEIATKEIYPKDYNETILQARNEINKKYTPELKTTISDIEKYDTIFLGTQNWWGSLLPAVFLMLQYFNNWQLVFPHFKRNPSPDWIGNNRSRVSNIKIGNYR